MTTFSQAFLEELFNCSLCHETMTQPASLNCGHSFCRKCLREALRHRNECPMCRAPCYTVADPKPNVILSALIREAALNEEESAQTEDGSSEKFEADDVSTRILPLFLSSSVQLPEITCSMHLFEPRYRLLTHRALDAGGDFAMVWVREDVGFPMVVDPASLAGVTACLVHIEQSRQLPDGRWNLLCKGTVPATIEECWIEEGTGNLFMAKLRLRSKDADVVTQAEPSDETGENEQVARPGSAATVEQKIQYIQTQMHLLGVSSQSLHRADPTRFSWEAASAAPSLLYAAGNEILQSLLELSDTDHRLLRLCDLYYEAFQQRWSLPIWIKRSLHRWGLMAVSVMVLYFAARRA